MTTAPSDLAERDIDTATQCSSCAHPMDAHDAIALRYCAATLQSVISRGCICQCVDAAESS